MSNTRARSKGRTKQDQVYHLTQALYDNGRAQLEGPKRKRWSRHDLKTIKPLTERQEDMFHAFMSGQNVVAAGSAGTGKTYIAIYLALNEILSAQSEASQLIIIRSVVPTREIGHLPGTLEEKAAVYELPYGDMFAELVGHANSYQDMKAAGIVQFHTTSFIRGLTWDNTIVVVDEGQNMDFHEINSLMTRIGQNSRVIFAGDIPQSDLRKKYETSGMDKFLRVAKRMSDFSTIEFTREDIVRSDFVKRWITACEDDSSAQ